MAEIFAEMKEEEEGERSQFPLPINMIRPPPLPPPPHHFHKSNKRGLSSKRKAIFFLGFHSNSNRYISYCIEEVELYRRFWIRPIFVFDGASVPAKLKSIKEGRLRERESKRKEGEDLMRMGKVKEANLKFKDSVDINPYHVYKLIQVLKLHKVEFVVAPYEADAQLAWMARNWDVDAVVTNDSDLILFGCPKVLTDVDRKGICQLIEFKQLRGDAIFGQLTFQQFSEACLFRGCDYLEGLPGMNLNKAAKAILQHSSYEKVITHLVDSNQWTKAYPKLEDYKRKYKMAVLTYNHQRIYNMRDEKIDYLTTPEDLQVENDKLAFLGPFIPKDIVQGIAKGELNPKTQKPLYDDGHGCGTNKRIHEEHTDVYSGRAHEPDPFSQKNTTCNYFTSGNCHKGTKCRYSHEEHTNVYSGRDHRLDPLSQKNTACKYFTSGNCREGTNCRYSHKGEALDRPEGRSADWRGHNLGNQNLSHRSNRSADQCIDFLNGQCERGSSCRYVHDDYVPDGSRHDTHKNNKTPCMLYASGRCRFGIRCSFSHDVEDLDGPKGRQCLNLGNENNSRGARKRGSEDFMPGFHVRKK